MSHFNVMVIGGAPIEEQLAPFVEVTPTGRDGFTGQKTTRTGALVARARRQLDVDPLEV